MLPQPRSLYILIFMFLSLTPQAPGNGTVQNNTNTTASPKPTNASVQASAAAAAAASSDDGLWSNMGNMTNLAISTAKKHVLELAKAGMKQFGSWGGSFMSIISPAQEGKVLNAKWELVSLAFRAGTGYEKAKAIFATLNSSQVIDFLLKNVGAGFYTGITVNEDGLGGLDKSLGERVVGSVYLAFPRHSGVPRWNNLVKRMPPPTCSGTRVVQNQAYQSFNIEVQFKRDEPLVFIAYITSYLGLDVKGCWARVENHGQLADLTEGSTFVRSADPNTTLVHPVVHITVNRARINGQCQVTLCSMREDHFMEGKPKEAHIEKVTFIFTNPASMSGTKRNILSINPRELKSPCSSGTKVITAIKYEVNTHDKPVPGPYRAICNGTKVARGFMPGDLGCFLVARSLAKVQCPASKSDVLKKNGDCSYSRLGEDCPEKHICIVVRTPGRGPVKVATEKERGHEDCKGECTFILAGTEATITCPNGEKHSVVLSQYIHTCPFAESGWAPRWVCRMSFRPSYVYILVLWYLFGYGTWRLFTLLTGVLLAGLAKVVRFFRARMDDTRGTCSQCGSWVPSKYHWQRHENCNNGRCPYCRMSCSRDKLLLHAGECNQRQLALQEDQEAMTIRLVPAVLRITAVAIRSFSKQISRAGWILVSLILLYLCVAPTFGLKDTAVDEDLWEQEVGFVEYCDLSCYQGEDDCVCPSVSHPSRMAVRKLLSLFPSAKLLGELASKNGTRQVAQHSQGPSTVSRKRVIDVTVPWGTLHVDSAYKPAYSGNHISLSWTETSSSGDHVTVNGKSQAVMTLEAGTGLMWEISSPKSKEIRRVFVSILDHTQVYTSRFLYSTGDREIKSWMQGRCTGDCPPKCACDTHMCHYNQYDDFSNWRCNPTWCWSIGSGCACCALGVKTLFNDWFVSKWELDYVESPVIACVETSPEDRICQTVSSGVTLQLGPISVQFSDVSGIATKLPKEVAVFHKTPKHDHFDVDRKVRMADGRTLCDVQSCTHGPAGDIQFYNVQSLFDKDHVNLNRAGLGPGVNQSNSWISWAGVSSYYTCHPGHWPDCHSTGVVEKNSEAFQNLWRSGDVSVNYFFHTEQIRMGANPTMVLKGRPWMGAGQITALLDVQGLTLKAKHVKPEGLHLDLSSCQGCYGCTTGFTCVVRIRMTHPDSMAVHMQSLTPDVVVPSISILAKNDAPTTYELKFYAADDVKKFCARLKESEASSHEGEACVNMQLVPPESVLLEHRRTLHSTSNATCTTGYISCVTSNMGSFFGGIGSFLKKLFGNLWLGIAVLVLCLLVIFILIGCGPNIFRIFLSCFQARRGYKRLIHFDSLRDEWASARKKVDAEKRKNKETEELLTKLSKVK
ncbi:glycoprotein [Nairoviridae sp.]|nr:glycoprotein [Nairoviridae sp.]